MPPALSDIQIEAWRSFVAAYSTATERVEAALAEVGLPSMVWYDVVWTIYKAPARRLRQYELAERMAMSPSGLSRLIDRIEASDLIRRERCKSDRRGADVVVTDEGAAMLRRMWPVYRKAIMEHFAHHVGEDAADLAAALGRVELAGRGAEVPA